MPDIPPGNTEFRRAFLDQEQQERVKTGKVGAILVVLLMPAGWILDKWVYPEDVAKFLPARLLCSALALGVWLMHWTSFGRRHYKVLGLAIPLLPAAFICWMIKTKAGATSPYYAGLNLILLAVSVVVRWTTMESLVAVLGVLLMYIAACFGELVGGDKEQVRLMGNNFYFLALTGIIVVVGNHFFNRLRHQEFTARFELDRNKHVLEISNKKLDLQNKELGDTIQKLTEAESQLVQSEKMASLGRMSAGIIHEINNPLNFATTGLFTLKKKGRHLPPEQQEEYTDIVKDIEEGIGRVKNIVSDLRMFTHPGTESLDQVEVSEAITSALRFLSNEIKDKVVVEQNLGERQTVRANKNKLIHVFVNLFQNSIDALRTKPFNNCEKPTISIKGRVERGTSYIIVRDNGPGIAREHTDKIFDPFFTTKSVGEGMGLGLSICYRILEESQGKISVRTEQGEFCEFTLELPAT